MFRRERQTHFFLSKRIFLPYDDLHEIIFTFFIIVPFIVPLQLGHKILC